METLSDAELYAILGAQSGADASALRAAYLAKIRQHPPEREPEMFERIRDAYQIVSDPVRKMRRFFDNTAIKQPVQDLLRNGVNQAGRPFLGAIPWLSALKQMERLAHSNRESHQ